MGTAGPVAALLVRGGALWWWRVDRTRRNRALRKLLYSRFGQERLPHSELPRPAPAIAADGHEVPADGVAEGRRTTHSISNYRGRTLAGELIVASRMHKVYALDVYVEYDQFVKYRSADEEVTYISFPYREFSDPNNLPKLVTVTVEANN